MTYQTLWERLVQTNVLTLLLGVLGWDSVPTEFSPDAELSGYQFLLDAQSAGFFNEFGDVFPTEYLKRFFGMETTQKIEV